MPVYAALTPYGNPLQWHIPVHDQRHIKIDPTLKVLKFESMALLTAAKKFAATDRGFGLFRIRRRDTTEGAIIQAPFCTSIDEFKDTLDIISYCEKCEKFTMAREPRRKCLKCRGRNI